MNDPIRRVRVKSGADTLSVIRSRPFIVGANMPWGAWCGHDFGLQPFGWGSERQDWNEIERELQILRANGITVVRWFLLASGVSYPCRASGTNKSPDANGRFPQAADDYARRVRTGIFSADAFEWEWTSPPPSLTPEFLQDFIALCTICQRNFIQLIPSLISFEWFGEPEHKDKGIYGGGRRRLIFGKEGADPKLSVRAFLNATLKPLLDRTTETFGQPKATFSQPMHPIFAWESINEPDWVTEGGPHLLETPSHPVTRSQMNAFLAEHRTMVLEAGYDHTIGFKQFDPKWLDSALKQQLTADRERYWHQGHHYPTVGFGGLLEDTLATNQTLPAKPKEYAQCLVGEFATASGVRDVLERPRLDNRKWQDPEVKASEEIDADYLFGRWQLIAKRGYDGGLLWAANSTDKRTRWDDVTQRQTLSFSRAMARQK